MLKKILIGVGIVLVLALLAAVPLSRILLPKAEKSLAEGEATRAKVVLREVRSACDMFALDNDGAYPPTLGALVPKYVEKIENDPWGRPYAYAADNNSDPKTCVVRSIGPDGQPGTSDDIVFAIVAGTGSN